jgi:hypothetical protein
MPDDTVLPFAFPAVGRKKVTAAFDGGRLTSDGGVLLLAAAERRLGIASRLAGLIADPRNPLLVRHSVADILRARILAIACGYEDADDLDHLRHDPGFKLACGRLPDSGADLCSQPTMSRWENMPSQREVARLIHAMIDLYCTSYARPPAAATLDIDDTCDVVHGHQQLALFNAHYDERCFLPIHVFDIAGASFGFTIGAQVSGLAMFFMTDAARAALDAANGWEIGTGPTVVAFDAGLQANMTSTTLSEPVYAISFSQQGLMASLAINGSKITRINPS